MDTLYEYALDWSAGSKRRHIDGERNFIERYIKLNEFDPLFGGKMLLTDPSGKSEFVGVWWRIKPLAISREFSGNKVLSLWCFMQTPRIESQEVTRSTTAKSNGTARHNRTQAQLAKHRRYTH